MVEGRCRNCGQTVDTGAYCQRCVDEIMVKALKPPTAVPQEESPSPRAVQHLIG